MKLLLIRHAKSLWPEGIEDHDRPLGPRGARDAPAMGAWVADRGLAPLFVLCSSSLRTRMTLGAMVPHWPEAPRVAFSRAVFEEDDEAGQMELLRRHGEGESVALVGHSPSIGALAALLAREAPAHGRWGDFPTCAVAALTFEGPLEPGRGEVTHFAVPADIGLKNGE